MFEQFPKPSETEQSAVEIDQTVLDGLLQIAKANLRTLNPEAAIAVALDTYKAQPTDLGAGIIDRRTRDAYRLLMRKQLKNIAA